jgi:ribosomal-protein-alanine N-acetyltransferase
LTYTIRRMAKEDLDQVNEIDREAFPSQWPPANYHQELQNKIAHYIVVYDDTKSISITIPPPKNSFNYISRLLPWIKKRRVQTEPPPPVTRKYIIGFSGLWMMADEAHVTNLAVRQEYRGKGLGELLLLATIDLAAQLNASFLTLEVRASNLVAQSLYGKYGFMQMGIRRGYYLDNREDAIIMSTETINSEPFRQQMRGLRETLAKKLTCNP